MGLGMGLIAFYPERRPLRCTGVLLAVAAGFGGALWAVSLASGGDGVLTLSFKNLLLAFALCYAVLCLLFRCRAALAEKRKAMGAPGFLGRSAEFIALVDTGNTLTDPLRRSCAGGLPPRPSDGLTGEHGALFPLRPRGTD